MDVGDYRAQWRLKNPSMHSIGFTTERHEQSDLTTLSHH
jgi:hypothetical protein